MAAMTEIENHASMTTPVSVTPPWITTVRNGILFAAAQPAPRGLLALRVRQAPEGQWGHKASPGSEDPQGRKDRRVLPVRWVLRGRRVMPGRWVPKGRLA